MDDLALAHMIEHVAEQAVVRALVAEEVDPRAMHVACAHVFDAIHADYGPLSEVPDVVGGCDLAFIATAGREGDWFRVVAEDAAGFRFELSDQVLRLA